VTARLVMALAAQLVFFAGWGAYLVTSHAGAPVVWLETEPVDPRDLLSGHYVALRYPISTVPGTGCELGEDAGTKMIYVRVQDQGRRLQTAQGEVAIAEPVACTAQRPAPGADERWIAGRLTRRNDLIEYGIERFYVGEDSALRRARSGSVVAQVAVGFDMKARIVALVDIVKPAEAPQ